MAFQPQTSTPALTQLSDAAALAASPAPGATVTLGYGHQADPGSDTRVHAPWQAP